MGIAAHGNVPCVSGANTHDVSGRGSADVPEDVRNAIEHIVYGYAERIDLGDLTRVAELFAHATYKGGGPDDPGVLGAAPVREILETMVRRYADGTPRTKHVTTNLVIDVDHDAGTAAARSYYTVFQQVDDFPLQPIIAGRYHDRFARVDGTWRLTERVIFCDLVGDLSLHLTTDPFA
jgi:hypothetical protein